MFKLSKINCIKFRSRLEKKAESKEKKSKILRMEGFLVDFNHPSDEPISPLKNRPSNIQWDGKQCPHPEASQTTVRGHLSVTWDNQSHN